MFIRCFFRIIIFMLMAVTSWSFSDQSWVVERPRQTIDPWQHPESSKALGRETTAQLFVALLRWRTTLRERPRSLCLPAITQSDVATARGLVDGAL